MVGGRGATFLVHQGRLTVRLQRDHLRHALLARSLNDDRVHVLVSKFFFSLSVLRWIEDGERRAGRALFLDLVHFSFDPAGPHVQAMHLALVTLYGVETVSGVRLSSMHNFTCSGLIEFNFLADLC